MASTKSVKALILTPGVKNAEAGRAAAQHPSDVIYLTNPLYQLGHLDAASSSKAVTDDDLSADDAQFNTLLEFSSKLAESWFLQNGMQKAITYRGVCLGEMVTRALKRHFFIVLRELYLVDRLLQLKEVGEVVLVDDGALWGKAVQFWCEQKGILLDRVTTRKGEASEKGSRRIFFTKKFSKWLKCFNRPSTIRPKTEGILFSAAPKYSMPILRQSRRNYYLRPSFSEKAFFLGKIHSFLHITPDDFAERTSRETGVPFQNIFGSMDHFFSFEPFFNTQGVNFWPLIREEMRRVVSDEFKSIIGLVDSFYGLLMRLKPRAVVVDEDVNVFNKTLVACANHKGIKTYCLIHGVPFAKINCLPSISNRIFAWGPSTKARFVNWGVPETKIIEAGAPQYEHIKSLVIPKVKKEVFKDFSIPKSSHLILLALSEVLTHESDTTKYPRVPLFRDIFERSLRITLGFLAKHDDVHLLIKPHPRYKHDWFTKGIIDEFDAGVRQRTGVVEKYSSEKIVAASALVLTTGSTVTYEAALLQRPALVFDYSGNRFCSFISDDFLDLNDPESCWARLEKAIRSEAWELRSDPYGELHRHFSGSGLNAVRRVLNEIGNGS